MPPSGKRERGRGQEESQIAGAAAADAVRPHYITSFEPDSDLTLALSSPPIFRLLVQSPDKSFISLTLSLFLHSRIYPVSSDAFIGFRSVFASLLGFSLWYRGFVRSALRVIRRAYSIDCFHARPGESSLGNIYFFNVGYSRKCRSLTVNFSVTRPLFPRMIAMN